MTYLLIYVIACVLFSYVFSWFLNRWDQRDSIILPPEPNPPAAMELTA